MTDGLLSSVGAGWTLLPSPITKGVSLSCSPWEIWVTVFRVLFVDPTYTLWRRTGGLHPLSSGALRNVQWKSLVSCPGWAHSQGGRLTRFPGGQAQLASLDPGCTGLSPPHLPTPVPRISAAGCPLVPQGHSIVSLSGSAPAHLGICLPTCLLFEAPPWWVGGQQLVRAWGRQWGEATSYLRGAVEFLLDDWVGGSGQGEGSLLRHPLNGLPWGSPVERTGM